MKNHFLICILSGLLLGCGDKEAKKGTTAPEAPVRKAQLTDTEYREKGLQYATAVQRTLGKTLQEKMKEGGPLEAISFCNVNALPLTDSMGQVMGADIRRITDQVRNPMNRAASDEIDFIAAFREDLASGNTPEPILIREGGTTNFYYPIVTNDLCLQCHGTRGEQIPEEVYQQIRLLYPGDEAIGYSANQVRGLWKVTFTEEQP